MRKLVLALSVAVLSSCGSDNSSSNPAESQGGAPSGGSSAAGTSSTAGSTPSGGNSSAGGGSSGSANGGSAGTGNSNNSGFGTWNTDTSFGLSGVQSVSSRVSNDYVLAAVRQGDGKVVVAGTDNAGVDLSGQVSGSVLVTRLNENGTVDDSFGNSGLVLIPVGYRASATHVNVQSDGKLLIFGEAHTAVTNGVGAIQPFVIRLLSDGKLDLAFGTNAITFLGLTGSLRRSAIQPDGSILAVGESFTQLLLVRFTTRGELDPSFGKQGMVLQSGTEGVLRGRDLTITEGGEIVVVGQSGANFGDYFVARYLPNGLPDESFGTLGSVTTTLEKDSAESLDAVALGPDNTIVVAGTAGAKGGIVLRYNEKGELDSNFGGGDGFTVTWLGGGGFTALRTINDGRWIATGSARVTAFLEDGTPDESFGPDGVSTRVYPFWFVHGVIAPDGATINVGMHQNRVADISEIVAVRTDASGAPDLHYGNAGEARFGSGATADMALEVVEDSAKNLTMLGTTARVTGTKFVVSRHSEDGSLDPSFGDQGFTYLKDMVHAAELLQAPAGETFVVGTKVFSLWQITVHRLLKDGTHDPNYGTAGSVEHSLITPGQTHARAAALTSDGKLLIAGLVSSATTDLALLKLDEHGQPDASFGNKGSTIADSGVALEELTAMALSKSGQIVVVGGGSQGNQIILGRFHADGQPDESFGKNGLLTPSLSRAMRVQLDSAVVQDDGKLLVAGYCRWPSGILVARFTSDGALDPTFADAGVLVHEQPEVIPYAKWVRGPKLLLLPDGNIIVAGTRTDSPQEQVLLLELSPRGELTALRSAAAHGSFNVFGATLLGDGKVLTVGRGFSEGGGVDYGLVRFAR